jgi:hypothetical protein
LQIAINENCGRAASSLKAGINGGALARIFLETNHLNIRPGCDSLHGAIARSIVHKDDFMIDFAQRRLQFRLQDRHVLLLIENGHDDRDGWRVCRSSHSGRVR